MQKFYGLKILKSYSLFSCHCGIILEIIDELLRRVINHNFATSLATIILIMKSKNQFFFPQTSFIIGEAGVETKGRVESHHQDF